MFLTKEVALIIILKLWQGSNKVHFSSSSIALLDVHMSNSSFSTSNFWVWEIVFTNHRCPHKYNYTYQHLQHLYELRQHILHHPCLMQSLYLKKMVQQDLILKGKKYFLSESFRGNFICTNSILISLSIRLRSSKFRNQFTMVCVMYLKRDTYSGPISFEVQ